MIQEILVHLKKNRFEKLKIEQGMLISLEMFIFANGDV